MCSLVCSQVYLMDVSFSNEILSLFDVKTFKSVVEIIFGGKFHPNIFNSKRFIVERNYLLTIALKNKNTVHLIHCEEAITFQKELIYYLNLLKFSCSCILTQAFYVID